MNDTDVYAHDIGLIAIEDESTGGLDGFNILVGGGMGMTHGSKKTYPRLGQLLGFCAPLEVSEVAEAIMLVQRDNGDRTNRKHARYIDLKALSDCVVSNTPSMTWVSMSSNVRSRNVSAEQSRHHGNICHLLRTSTISVVG